MPSAQGTSSPLLRFPGELRNEIYSYLMPNIAHYYQLYQNPMRDWIPDDEWGRSKAVRRGRTPAELISLMKTCRLLYREASAYFYSNIVYSVGSELTGTCSLRWIRRVPAQHLRRIGLTISCSALASSEKMLRAVAHRGINIETLNLCVISENPYIYESLGRRQKLSWTKPLPDEVVVDLGLQARDQWKKEQIFFRKTLVRILKKMKSLRSIRVYVRKQGRGAAWLRALADQLVVEVRSGCVNAYLGDKVIGGDVTVFRPNRHRTHQKVFDKRWWTE